MVGSIDERRHGKNFFILGFLSNLFSTRVSETDAASPVLQHAVESASLSEGSIDMREMCCAENVVGNFHCTVAVLIFSYAHFLEYPEASFLNNVIERKLQYYCIWPESQPPLEVMVFLEW